ncbi:hypothetical protein MUJ63_04280 [Lachnospiraceae bacterium NSJ-143]|nr:hypothetical protein [Lachnospiraceae bacterium NSJ-143]
MKKAINLLVLIPAFVFLLCGCFSPGKADTPMEKIQERLNSMQGYYCTADLTRFSSKGESKFGVKQYFKMTGQYRMEMVSPDEVAGNFTVYDGKTICQYNPRVKGKIVQDVPENKARNELFLGQFVKNYMNSEGVSLAVSNIGESRCTVLEAVIPGDNKFTSTEKLWIDNETLNPVKLVIYDADGKEKYIIEYNEFQFDPEFEENIFSVSAVE